MTTKIELLRLEIQLRTVELENERLQSQLNSKPQKHPAPQALRLFVWFTCAAGLLTAMLILAKAILVA